ncbi:MAG: asparagine synthase (glutamine-hydrolyzing) [Gammaproteobacteria bacterium]|nr:asparagine synthase (glutamine-hydrolyzing) [Gammaproteobacteria bacterium]
MCGIAGYVCSATLAGLPDGPAMVSVLHHRGPDAAGGHAARVAGRQVFLGHARLSIIDLSAAGNQPMFTAGGQVALVFNGEVYNFQQLRERFLRDTPMASRTDTEVVLKLYEQRGIDSLRELNGDFALALLDQRSRRLYLVRDRIGVKPLYYSITPDRLLFGSEVKALVAGGLRPELDTEGLQRYFVFKYTPGTDTLFQGVRRVPPGHYLELDLDTGRHQLHQWWVPGFRGAAPGSYAEARAELRELVADATRLRLIADVPVGTFLSGGLDSSIIASFLRGNNRITHYCASQDAADVAKEGTVSDFHHARRLADDWGLRLLPVDIGAGNLTLPQIETTVRHADDLIADAAQIPSWLITRGAAATSRVFLSGMGADEIFLGYAGHQLALLWSWIERMPRPLLRALAGIDQGRGSLKAFRRYLYRLGKYGQYPAYRYAIFSIVGDFENSASVVAGDREALADFLAGYFPEGADPFESYKRFEYENFLQKNLAYMDAMSMANSVEVRVPFLDHRILDFAWSLPRHWKLGPLGQAKKILVDSFAADLPDYILRRRKAGFGMPIRSIFQDPAAVWRLLDVERLASVAAFDAGHIRRLVDSHEAGREDNSSIIYALVSFQAWHQVHFGA